MLNIRAILNLAFALNCVWIIAGNPLTKDTFDQILTHLSYWEEGQITENDNILRDEGGDQPLFDIRFDSLPSHCSSNSSSIPTNCAQATACTKLSGYYRIKLDSFSKESFLVECDAHTDGGDWTVIQRRLDGSENFFRSWSQYKSGFGEIEGEHFIGLDKLYALTNFDGRQELLVLIERNDQMTSYAKYSSFAIGNETDRYILKRVGQYSGTAGDSLQSHVGSRFSTMDHDNGNTNPNSAITFSSGWWYNTNRISDLNGLYGKTDGKGILWNTFKYPGRYIRTVTMMIRRLRVNCNIQLKI